MNKIEGSIKVLDSNFEKGVDEAKIEGYIQFEYDPEGESSCDDIMQPITKEIYGGIDAISTWEKEQNALLCYMEAVRNVMRDAADKLDELMMDKKQTEKGRELKDLLEDLKEENKVQDKKIEYIFDKFEDDE